MTCKRHPTPTKKVVKLTSFSFSALTHAHTHSKRNEHRGRMKTQVKERGGFFSEEKKKRFQFAGFKCGEVAETAELGCAGADVSQAQ